MGDGTGFDDWGLKMLGAGIVCLPLLIGLLLPKKFMKKNGYYIISFAVASMMATVFLELLPELLHEAPGKVGTVKLHWVNGGEYAQLSKGMATILCAILLAGLVFGGIMESFLLWISPHAHGHSHGHGQGHGHGDCGHDDDCASKSCGHGHAAHKHHGCGDHKHSHGHGPCNHDHHQETNDSDEGQNYGHDGFYVDENGVYTNIPKKSTAGAIPKSPKTKNAHGVKPVPEVDVDLEKGEPSGIKRPTTCGLPTLIVLDLVARTLHHTIDGIVAGVQNTHGGMFWGTIMGLTCHEIGHSLGGIGLYMSMGVGKYKSISLIALTQVVTTFLGTFLGMWFTHMSTDAMLDIWMQPVAIGIMMYISLIDLLPELSHMPATRKMKFINVGVVLVALFSVLGVGLLIPHSHGAGVGNMNYYQQRALEVGQGCGHDHSSPLADSHDGDEPKAIPVTKTAGGHDHDDPLAYLNSQCCGHDHGVDMAFQARQTMIVAQAAIIVVEKQKENIKVDFIRTTKLKRDDPKWEDALHDYEHEQEDKINREVHDLVESYLKGTSKEKMSAKPLWTHFRLALYHARTGGAIPPPPHDHSNCGHNH